MTNGKSKILINLGIAFVALLLLFGVATAQDTTTVNPTKIEEAIALIQTMPVEKAVEFLVQENTSLSAGVLSAMDIYTEVYYLNYLQPEDAQRILLSVPEENAAACLSVMEMHTAANICQGWSELEQAKILRKIDQTIAKNIYALLDLPKVIIFEKDVYEITPASTETISADYDCLIPEEDLTAVSGNETILKLSKLKTQDNKLMVELTPVFQGSTTFTIETVYGRVLSAPITVYVNSQSSLPAVQSAASAASGIAAGYNKPAVPPQPASPSFSGQQVWITKSGKRYHFNPSCVKEPIETTMENALAHYKPCSKCVHNPPAAYNESATYSTSVSTENHILSSPPSASSSPGTPAWITETGECYHLDPNCVQKPIPKTMEDAIAQGYRPCRKCAQ